MSGEKETGAESVLDSEELAILEEEGVDVDAIEDDSGDETGLDASPETPEGEPEAPGEGEERVNPAENAPPWFCSHGCCSTREGGKTPSKRTIARVTGLAQWADRKACNAASSGSE